MDHRLEHVPFEDLHREDHPEQSRLPPEEPLHGSPARIVEQLGQYAESGTTRVYVRLRDLSDLDHLDLLMTEVAPQLS
ncbi:hypothetical protein ACFU53_20585 [Streptomyces sp. NPDC057474]|uniref:hypothetical protein n=1 Tax=Streptomyces sp. NPDC057474 TaxID=3346144 RepID=UPI0036D11B03